MTFIIIIIIILSLFIYKYVIFNFKIFRPIKYLSNDYINLFNNTDNIDNDDYIKINEEYIKLIDEYNKKTIELKSVNDENLNLMIKKNQLINIYDNLQEREQKMSEFINKEKDKILMVRFLKIFEILYIDFLIKEDNKNFDLIPKFNNTIFKTYLGFLLQQDVNY